MAITISQASLEIFRNKCIAEETSVEAGYVNDPADLGGETNHGITIGTANECKSQLTKRFGWDGTMINLTEEMAYWIYANRYWHPMKLDMIATKFSKYLAFTMFRWGLKSGCGRPVEFLQRTLNVLNNEGKLYGNIVADGLIGPKTFAAIEGLVKRRGHEDAVQILNYILNSQQVYWMFHISEVRADEDNERFTWGWITRIAREEDGYYKEHGPLDV